MIKATGECRCGLQRDIECDDSGTLQKIKDVPCPNCGSTLKYKSGHED